MTFVCSAPIPLEELLAYRRGELDAEAEERLEEHYFSCTECASRLAWVEALEGAAVEALARGEFSVSATDAVIERLRAAGSAIRVYDLAEGQSVNCTIAPHEDMVVTKLRVSPRPGRAVSLLTQVRVLETGAEMERVERVLADPVTGQVVVLLPGAAVRQSPRATYTMRLRFGDEPDAELSTPVVMNHSPWELSDEYPGG